jgi:predicted nucleic acid-binding protein
MTSEDIFVDTSAWIALADRDDSFHQKAASVFPSILKTFRTLITSNFTIAETYVLLLHELGHPSALRFLERLKGSPKIFKIFSTEDIESESEEILTKYTDQDFSYTDAVSFVIMKRHKIRKAFCFDKHFVTAGFINVP